MKMLNIIHELSGVILICMLLTACGNSTPPEPTPQIKATEAPKVTETPKATEATTEIHQWESQPVLVNLYEGPGMADYSYAWSLMPKVVMYADGRLIMTHNYYTSQTWTRSIQEISLSPTQICAILTQIDSNGFFDFNPNDYDEPQITDQAETRINVEAWRSKTVDAYALDHALHPDMGKEIKVPPALANTYNFLVQYDSPDRKPYQPDQIAVLISPSNNNAAAPLWSLKTVSLKDIASNLSDNRGEVILKGQDATEAYALFAGEVVKIFTEGDNTYQLAVRPILPLEIWLTDKSGWGIIPRFEDSPKTEMTCGGKADTAQSTTP